MDTIVSTITEISQKKLRQVKENKIHKFFKA